MSEFTEELRLNAYADRKKVEGLFNAAAAKIEEMERKLADAREMIFRLKLSAEFHALPESLISAAEVTLARIAAISGPELALAVDVPRLLTLLKRARHFSDGMNLAAYEAIQNAISELEPNQPK